jgi:hypothetical protein
MRIVNIVILLVFLVVISKSMYNVIKDLREHRKRMKKLDQWSKFHHQLIEWSSEIVDQNVRYDFMNNFVSKLLKQSTERLDEVNGIDQLDDFDLDKEKQKVFEVWGKHIPSLTQEIRENKLNSLL